jgi:membrane-associated phospholipid phosphatase
MVHRRPAPARACLCVLLCTSLLISRLATAQTPPATAIVPPASPPPTPSGSAPASAATQPPASPPPTPSTSLPASAATQTLTLGPPPLEPGQHFAIDPVADGALIAGGGGLAVLLSLVLGTNEIAPPLPGPTSNLLPLDRLAVTQTIDPHAATYSNIGLGVAVGFAVLDPVLSGFRDGWDALEVDAVMYAETISLAEMITDLTKVAVRRPRPIDYIDCPYGVPGRPQTGPGCQSTDLGLSFFSGHAATIASIGGTATYLAFVRNRHSVRPWLTLVASTALTSFVSYERVRAGAHFPTDVIAGSLFGGAIGVFVPHVHLHPGDPPRVVVGAVPLPGGGELTLGGIF